MGGVEAVHISTGLRLRDLDGGSAEDGLGEMVYFTPTLATIGGALIVVVLVVQLLALGRLEDLAGLQVAQQIGRAGLDGGAGLGGIAGLAGGNGHGLGLGRGLVAVGIVALLLRRLVLGVAAVVGVIGGILAGIGIAGTAVVGGIGVLVGVGGGILSVVGGDGLRGLRYVIRPGGYRRVSHQGERHGQRQQKRKQSFAFFMLCGSFRDFSLYKAFRQKALRRKLPPKSFHKPVWQRPGTGRSFSGRPWAYLTDPKWASQ